MKDVEWEKLHSLAHRLSDNIVGPGGLLDSEWIIIDQALNLLIKSESWADIIKTQRNIQFPYKR